MVTTQEPEDIITEFLRGELTDPRGRHTNTSDSFNGDNIVKTFTLTNKGVRLINSVTVGGTPQSKYLDYTFDMGDASTDGTVTFVTAPPIGVDNVVIDYDYGASSWIFPDMPRLDLTSVSYPRISVTKISDGGETIGFSTDDSWDLVRLQIDVFVRRDDALTYNSVSMTGVNLLNAISRDLTMAIKNNWRGNLSGANLRGPQKINDFNQPYDEDHKLFRKTIEYEFRGQNVGDATYV